MLTYIIIGIVVLFVILLCVALAIASFSYDNYYESLKKTNEMKNKRGLLTLQYVSDINEKYFEKKLDIMKCAEYQDHYSSGIVALSEKTMISNSLASLSIVSHELGHARQDREGNKLNQHWKLRKIGKVCGFFFLPIMVVGAVLSLLYIFKVLSANYYLIAGLSCLSVGVLIFIFSIFLKYKEIEIEKEASVFALEFLKEFLYDDEIKICKEFLDSARLTYWAGLFKTMFGWTLLTGRGKMFR